MHAWHNKVGKNENDFLFPVQIVRIQNFAIGIHLPSFLSPIFLSQILYFCLPFTLSFRVFLPFLLSLALIQLHTWKLLIRVTAKERILVHFEGK